ncbi:MAG: mechanosensitive ion channel family protein [Bacteroidota bacterium]
MQDAQNANTQASEPAPIDGPADALELILSKLQTWFETFVASLPNLAVAVLVVILFYLLSKLVRSGIDRGLTKVSDNQQIARLLSSIARIATIAVGAFIALEILGQEKAVTSLLAGAGIIGLALGFAFQDVAANFISGVILALRRPFQTGDMVELNDTFGKVERVDLRATVLRTTEGQTVLIPNQNVLTNKIVNFTESPKRRIDVEVGVSYATDLEFAERIAREALEEVPNRDTDRPVEIFFGSFGGSSIDFVGRFWVPYHTHIDYLRAKHEGVKRIKSAFDANDITIPFPIRTLDFGIEGGQTLTQALTARNGEPVSTNGHA